MERIFSWWAGDQRWSERSRWRICHAWRVALLLDAAQSTMATSNVEIGNLSVGHAQANM
jgi:hypothetical protein